MKSLSLLLMLALTLLLTVAMPAPAVAKVKNPDPRPQACYTSSGDAVAPLPNGSCPPGTTSTPIATAKPSPDPVPYCIDNATGLPVKTNSPSGRCPPGSHEGTYGGLLGSLSFLDLF